ncbi:MAG: CDP-alcohol phosphatidyltransferase family protein [Gammaproteobacteria bacterium]|nr:CDP-alcohol phosphatidyltransferase family protein [Gammaproteobacteria bacterium]
MSHDTWLHRSVRASVRPLIDTPVTPNHITTARLVTGLAAAALFALDSQYWAAAMFLLSMLLDRADGELARASGKSTARGHQYDLVTDTLCNALAFVGIGISLRHGVFGAAAIPMGIVAGAAIICILWWVTRIEQRHGRRAGELRALPRFDPDDVMIVIPAAALLDCMAPLLAAAAVGAPLFAWAAYQFHWRGLLDEKPDLP